jgi:hypothetical protein
MMAAVLERLSLPRPAKPDVQRALAAGGAWGLILAAGLTAMSAWQCGGLCLEDVAFISAVSIAAGILGIGPVVAFGSKRR